MLCVCVAVCVCVRAVYVCLCVVRMSNTTHRTLKFHGGSVCDIEFADNPALPLGRGHGAHAANQLVPVDLQF